MHFAYDERQLQKVLTTIKVAPLEPVRCLYYLRGQCRSLTTNVLLVRSKIMLSQTYFAYNSIHRCIPLSNNNIQKFSPEYFIDVANCLSTTTSTNNITYNLS